MVLHFQKKKEKVFTKMTQNVLKREKNKIKFFLAHWPYNTCNPNEKKGHARPKISEITSHSDPKMHV